MATRRVATRRRAEAVAAIEDSGVRAGRRLHRSRRGPTAGAAQAGRPMPARARSSPARARPTCGTVSQRPHERSRSQVLVNGTVPAEGRSGQVNVTVTGDAGGTPVTDSTIALVASESHPADAERRRVADAGQHRIWPADEQASCLASLLGLLFLGLLVMLAFALNAATPTRQQQTSAAAVASTRSTGRQGQEAERDPTAFGEQHDRRRRPSTSPGASRRSAASRSGCSCGWKPRGTRCEPAEWILIHGDHRPAAASVRLRHHRPATRSGRSSRLVLRLARGFVS